MQNGIGQSVLQSFSHKTLANLCWGIILMVTCCCSEGYSQSCLQNSNVYINRFVSQLATLEGGGGGTARAGMPHFGAITAPETGKKILFMRNPTNWEGQGGNAKAERKRFLLLCQEFLLFSILPSGQKERKHAVQFNKTLHVTLLLWIHVFDLNNYLNKIQNRQLILSFYKWSACFTNCTIVNIAYNSWKCVKRSHF